MNFPFQLQSPPEHQADLPKSSDVVIVGAGVIGITTALWLARQGVQVTVLEKGRVAAEQSSRNWGWIRVQGRDMDEIPIAQEAQRLWQELEDEANGALGLRQVGVAYLAKSDKDMAAYQDWLKDAAAFGVSSKLVDKAGLKGILPEAQKPWAGALWTPTDLKAEPWVAVPTLARMAREAGATIIENCATRVLDISAGRVSGVVAERGRIASSNVLVAAGAWSALFLRRHGVSIPQLSVRSTALATEPLPQVTGIAAVDNKVAFRPRLDGGYTLAPSTLSELYIGPDAFRMMFKYLPLLKQGGFDVRLKTHAPKGFPDAWGTPRTWGEDEVSPFERMRILNPAPNLKKAQECMDEMSAAFPEVGVVRAKATWAGMIDVMPDVVPVVDHVAGIEGLTIATGMCGHGFGIGPAFGKIAAELLTGQTVSHDLTRFRFNRFTDGSTMRPGPNI